MLVRAAVWLVGISLYKQADKYLWMVKIVISPIITIYFVLKRLLVLGVVCERSLEDEDASQQRYKSKRQKLDDFVYQCCWNIANDERHQLYIYKSVLTFYIAVGGTTLRRGWRRHRGSGERDDDYQMGDEDDEGGDDDDYGFSPKYCRRDSICWQVEIIFRPTNKAYNSGDNSIEVMLMDTCCNLRTKINAKHKIIDTRDARYK